MTTTTRHIVSVEVIGDQALKKFQSQAESLNVRLRQMNTTTQQTQKVFGGLFRLDKRQLNDFRNISYQINDIFVQIAGGQGVLRALSQQIPQIAQIFGPWGQVIAVAAAAFPLLVSGIKAFIGQAATLEEVMKANAKAQNDYNQFLSEGEKIIKGLISPYKDYSDLAKDAAKNLKDSLQITAKSTFLDEANAQLDQFQLQVDSAVGALKLLGDEAGGRAAQRGNGEAFLFGGSAEDKKNFKEMLVYVEQLSNSNLANGEFAKNATILSEQIVKAAGSLYEMNGYQRIVYNWLQETIIKSEEFYEGIEKTNEEWEKVGKTSQRVLKSVVAEAQKYFDILENFRSDTANLNTLTVGLKAEANALRNGSSALDARTASLKAVREEEYKVAMANAGTIDAANKIYNAWQAWNDALDANVQAQKDVEEATKKTSKAVKTMSDDMKLYQKVIQDFQKDTASLQTESIGLEAEANALRNGASLIDARTASLKAMRAEEYKVAIATAKTAGQANDLYNEWQAWNDALDANVQAQKDVEKATKRVSATIKAMSDDMKLYIDTLSSFQSDTSGVQQNTISLKAETDALRNGSDALAARTAGLKAVRAEEYKLAIATAKTIGQANDIYNEWQAWNDAIDENVDAQRNLQAQLDASSRTIQQMANSITILRQAISNLNSQTASLDLENIGGEAYNQALRDGNDAIGARAESLKAIRREEIFTEDAFNNGTQAMIDAYIAYEEYSKAIDRGVEIERERTRLMDLSTAAAKGSTSAIKDLNGEMEDFIRTLMGYRTDSEKDAQAMSELKEQYEAFGHIIKDQPELLELYDRAIKDLANDSRGLAGDMQDFTQILSSSFNNGFNNVINKTKSVSEAFKNMAISILASIAQLYANKLFLNLLGSFGIPGLGASTFSAASAPTTISAPVTSNFAIPSPNVARVAANTNTGLGTTTTGTVTRSASSLTGVVVNNYNGSDVQTRRDRGIIEIAVNEATANVEQRFARSMRTGQGSYSSAIEGGYKSRRRF